MLLVGAGPALENALTRALSRQGIQTRVASTDLARDAVRVVAPDFVVLAGAAVLDGGVAMLDELSNSPVSSVVPVIVLGEFPTLAQRLGAIRHGAAAILSRPPSTGATADRLAKLAREISERTRQTFDGLGDTALADFSDVLSQQMRNEALGGQASRSDAGVRRVFGGGRPLAKLVNEFVQRRGRPVANADVVDDPRALSETPAWSPLGETALAEQPSEAAALMGLRVALADHDVARADTVAQNLRARGATVLVVDLSFGVEQRLDRLQQLDPHVLVIGQQHLWSNLLRRVYRDVRLRWATLWVVDGDCVRPGPAQSLALDLLASRLVPCAQPERDLQLRLRQGVAFHTRLENNGPSRLLHALVEARDPLRVSIHAPHARVELDLSEGLVTSIATTGSQQGEAPVDDVAALALLDALESGRVSIAPAPPKPSSPLPRRPVPTCRTSSSS